LKQQQQQNMDTDEWLPYQPIIRELRQLVVGILFLLICRDICRRVFHDGPRDRSERLVQTTLLYQRQHSEIV